MNRKAIIARNPVSRGTITVRGPLLTPTQFSVPEFPPVPHSVSSLITCIRRLSAAAALVALAGCASAPGAPPSTLETYFPVISQWGVYRLDINQGNFLSQDMVDKLKVGQTRSQVRLALGTPLVMSAFRDQRWDYIYVFARGGRVREQRLFTVYFQDDLLARWEGDEMPTSAQELNRLAATRSLPEDPYGQDGGVIGKIIDFFRRIGDPSAPPTP